MNCKARRWASSWKNIDLDHRNHLPEVDFGDFRYVFRMFTRGREHIDHVVAVFFKKTCSPWPTILSQTVIGCLGHPRFWARIEYFSKKSPILGQNRGGPNTFNMLWRYWTEMNWEQVDWFSAYSFSFSSSCSNKMATICERYWKIFTLGHRNHFLEVICRDFRYAIGFTSSGREHISSEKTATIWFRFVKILE